MKATILNRDFKHPADGWYHIEPKGEHINRNAKITQVIDDEAVQTIVNRFNRDADDGKLSHGHEMLIDHEHFKHDADKETIAYGWLQRLANRDDGIYGQIRWSATGQKSVDGGDYRFFSTEYDKSDLKVINDRRVRPLRLDGLTLTNDPNNKGARPITNRALAKVPADGCCPTCECDLVPSSAAEGQMTCPECQTNFANAGASAANNKNNQVQNRNRMKNIATKLGLAAEASEDAILEAVTKIQNRLVAVEPLAEENTKLKNRLTELDAANVDALLAGHGVTDVKVLNRIKPVLTGMAAGERQAFLDEVVPKANQGSTAHSTSSGQTKLFNRGTKTPGAADTDDATERAEQTKATKIMNRASELRKQNPNLSDATAVTMAQREVEAAS